jgi:NAD(P)-dependent dehydrogenase (short-subunit alcohol dehydrogenase family)
MVQDSKRIALQDRVAIITGAARGIGKVIAALFVRNGAKVVIVSRNAQEVKKTVNQLTDDTTNVIGIPADVSILVDIEKVVSETLNVFKTIDILVNCAGVQKPIGPLTDVSIKDWTANIYVNLIGTVICCKTVLPIMIEKRGGKIINFSGGGATSPRPNFTAYACSKAAIVRFTETLAMEVKDHGIDVNAIAPGPVNTRMLREIVEAGNKAGKKELEEVKKMISKGAVPPEHAAQLALFLASDASNGITGRLISAIWDDWRNFSDRVEQIKCSALYTIRRIDGKSFQEIRQ